jgi:hypothetical protein
VGLPFLVAQLIQMIREDEADAKVIDAELDAAAAGAPAEAALAGAGGSGSAPAAAPAAQRPWWESDQRFAGRFEAVSNPAAPDPGEPAPGQ